MDQRNESYLDDNNLSARNSEWLCINSDVEHPDLRHHSSLAQYSPNKFQHLRCWLNTAFPCPAEERIPRRVFNKNLIVTVCESETI